MRGHTEARLPGIPSRRSVLPNEDTFCRRTTRFLSGLAEWSGGILLRIDNECWIEKAVNPTPLEYIIDACSRFGAGIRDNTHPQIVCTHLLESFSRLWVEVKTIQVVGYRRVARHANR